MYLKPEVIDRAIAAGWKPPWHMKTKNARIKFGPRTAGEIHQSRDYWLSPDGSRLEPLPQEFYEIQRT